MASMTVNLFKIDMKIILRILFIIAMCLTLSGCVGLRSELGDIFLNIQRQLQPIWQFLNALSWVLGIVFVAIAILKLKQYGQMTVMMSTHASLGPSLAYLLVGLGLLFLPTLLDVMNVTFFGYGTEAIQGYEESLHFADIMAPIFQVIQVIGLIAFIRGWIILLRIGSQGSPPGTLGKAFVHMIGGILAINVTGTLEILRGTFGLV
jgi:intracellular multiplication protein IcmC